MTVFDYIKRRIDVFLELFPNAKVKYGHDSFARTHIVEISPDSVFEEDSFRRWYSETIEGFIRLCPEENLCVTPEDDVMPIDNPSYSKEGISAATFSSSQSTLLAYVVSFGNDGSLAKPLNYSKQKEHILPEPVKINNGFYYLAA